MATLITMFNNGTSDSSTEFRDYVNLMNGNYTFVPIHGNAVPMGGQGMLPPPPYAQYPVPAPIMDPLAYPVPPMPPVSMPTEQGENAHVNNGHQQVGYPIPHHQIILGQPIRHGDILISPNADRLYYPYNRMPEDHRQPVQYRPDLYPPPQYVPPMPNMFPAQDATIQREDLYNPGPAPELVAADYRVNAPPPQPPTYASALRADPRAETAVWAPNPEDIFFVGEMLNALPAQTLPPQAEASPQRSTNRPLASRRSSPVDGVGPLAVGGPVSAPVSSPGPNGPRAVGGAISVPGSDVPRVIVGHIALPGSNGPLAVGGPISSSGPNGSRLVGCLVSVPAPNGPSGSNGLPPVQVPNGPQIPIVVARMGANRSPSVGDRLSAAAHAYQASGLDDQELEAGLQALERRIDTEFKNAD